VTAAVAAAAVTAAVGTTAAQAATSSGTFGSVVYLKNVVSPTVAMPTAVAIRDVTGDGRPDLVVTTVDRNSVGGNTTVAVYPQLPGGKLGAPVIAKTSDQNDVTTRITITDLYGNGQKEILLPEQYHVDVFSYSHGRLTGTQIPVPANDLAVADFNGDHHPDLLIATDQSDEARIYTGSVSHKFTQWRTLTFPGAGGYEGTVFAGDFDRNGRMDVALFTGSSFGVRVQTAPGTFGAGKVYKNVPIGGMVFPPSNMVVGDVTGDGYPDVITDSLANSPWSGVEVFAGNRSGTLKPPVVYPTLDSPTSMTVADLSGNGRKDLVIEHACWGNVGVMRQRSNGTFAPEALYPVFTCDNGPDQPAVGDLNGDGKPDIAVTSGEDGIGILYAK
jgi:hypothetical protein